MTPQDEAKARKAARRKAREARKPRVKKPMTEEDRIAKAERQRVRRENMTPEQKKLENRKATERAKLRGVVKDKERAYNRQFRRRVEILNPNHKAYSVQIGKVNYVELRNQFNEVQKGHCAICGRHEDDFPRNHALDHDHETLVVRGLLCWSCNSKLGWVENNLAEIIDYLELGDG